MGASSRTTRAPSSQTTPTGSARRAPSSPPREPPRRRAPGSGSSASRPSPPRTAPSPSASSRGAATTIAGSDVAVESAAVVADLAFGDVWLCAGQSNMQFTVAASFDAAAAIAESATFGDGIRIATVAMTAADVERDDATAATAGDAAYEKSAWAKATPHAFNPPVTPDPHAPYGGCSDMGWFSAACWFHGLELYARSSREVPVGLITAAWGGQAIEPFSSKEALADETCGGTRGPRVPQGRAGS